MEEQTNPPRQPAKAAPRKRTTAATATARPSVAAPAPVKRTPRPAKPVEPVAETPKPKAPRVRPSRATPEPVPPRAKPDHQLTQLEIVYGDPPIAPAPPIEPSPPVKPDQRVELTEPVELSGRADPADAGQRAARDAVALFGPEARDWVARTHDRYPTARPAAVARLATVESIDRARRRGAPAGVRLIAADEARLVLVIAAAYGVDPTAPARATELIDLLRVPDPSHTMALVRGAGWSLAGVAAQRLAARLVPFGAVLTRSVQSGRRLEAVATRADAYYRRLGR